MKNGASSLIVNEGRTSDNKTIAFGVDGPTKSIAADKIITYKILFSNPNMKNEANVFCDSDTMNIFWYVKRSRFSLSMFYSKTKQKK